MAEKDKGKGPDELNDGNLQSPPHKVPNILPGKEDEVAGLTHPDVQKVAPHGQFGVSDEDEVDAATHAAIAAAQEESESEEDDDDDDDMGLSRHSSQDEGNAALMQSALRSFEAANARLKLVETIRAELSGNLYKNAVRIVKSSGRETQKLGPWHDETLPKIIKELKKNKEVVIWKEWKFALEVIFRSMGSGDAKQNTQLLRDAIRGVNAEKQCSIIPPYSPEMR